MRYHKRMKIDQRGDSTTIVIATLAFISIALLALASWALYQYNAERTSVDMQVAAAVQEAREEQQALDEAAFEEERRSPWRTYQAPEIFGGIELLVPKNWSIYAEDSTSNSVQLDLFVHPGQVRMQQGATHPKALRLQLLDELYSDVMRDYQRSVEQGEVRSRTARVSDINGVRLSGQVTREQTGEMVVLPYRDKTILIWSEGERYLKEFDQVLERAEISR